MEWSRIARAAIGEAHERVPPSATLKERRAIIDAAYPFGQRAMWPYKAWLKARKAYLAKFAEDGTEKGPPPTALDLMPRDPATGRPLIK